jgi:hypothetical protein
VFWIERLIPDVGCRALVNPEPKQKLIRRSSRQLFAELYQLELRTPARSAIRLGWPAECAAGQLSASPPQPGALFMKIALTAIAAAIAVVAVAPPEASAKTRANRTQVTKKYAPSHQRAASVQANGLCQRDTGTPNSQLDFRNRCDMEEFWARTFERGSGSTK